MKAQITKHSVVTGKTISKKTAKVFFASSEKRSCIEVIISSNAVYEISVTIPTKELLALIFARMVDKLKI
jgi:hypothetical protein